jgi:anaerobic ribonucleoside-triphosphate reductase activating protein
VASRLASQKQCLHLHGSQAVSRANGPGLRGVLWLQGCTLGCPGCFNPDTHSQIGGELWSIETAVNWAAQLPPDVRGITISGGEPLQQIVPLSEFLIQLRSTTTLSIVVFTGFEMPETRRMPAAPDLLASIDVLITGRYIEDVRVARSLVGSANKTLHFLTGRYTTADFWEIPEAEITVAADGEISFSGIDPMNWG